MRNVILTMLAICLTAAAASAGTLALWNFDDKAVGESAVTGERLVDSSGNGRDAYITSTAVPEFWDSNPEYGTGAAIHTAATNAKIVFEAGHDFGDSGAVAGTAIGDYGTNDSFTMEAVVRYPTSNDSGNKYCCIFSKIGSGGSSATQWWWRVQGSAGDINFFMKDENGSNAGVSSSSVNVNDGNWHHVAVVRDASASILKLYVDYAELASTSDTTTGSFANDGLFRIGNFRDTDTRDMIGSMDVARISDVALVPSQFIQKLELPVLPANPDPVDRAFNISTASVELIWDTMADLDPNVTVNAHTVTIATDANFDNIAQVYNGVTGNSVTFTGMENALKYFWRVDTQGTHVQNGSFFEEGNVWSFQTEEVSGDVAGYWAFDDVAPGTVMLDGDRILDSSGNNRDLYLLNEDTEELDPSYYDNSNPAFGAGGSYLGFDDAQMKLYPGYDFGGGNIAGSPIIIPSGEDFTVEAVVRFNADEDDLNCIMSFIPDHPIETYWYGYDLPQYWFRGQTDGKIRFWLMDDNEQSGWCQSTTAIYDGLWHHVAGVRDKTAGKVRVYIDGVLEAETDDNTATDILPGGYMVVGGFTGYSSRNWEGNLDYVKVTRAALGPADFPTPMALPTDPNPVDGATGIPTTYVLSWTPIAGATITTQTVVLATDPFMLNVVDSIVAATGTNSVPVSDLDNETNYYWRVDTDGTDTSGSFSRQGSIWGFRTPLCVLEMAEGDINEDCSIDLLDFAIMSANWLRSEYE